MNAVVLAGSSGGGALEQTLRTNNKALIEISGRPMAQYVIDALRRVPEVKEIRVVGPVDDLRPRLSGEGVTFHPAGPDLIDNLLGAVLALPKNEEVLIVTSDAPLLTPAVIARFLAQCRQREADFYYPIVERKVSEARYPLAKRTYVALREGAFTGGNLMLLGNPALAEEVAPRVRQFFANRKSPLKLAGLLGWWFVLKLLLKIATIPELERQVSSLWGLRGAAIQSPDPEIGIDVDKPSDLQLVRAVLR